MRRSCHCADHSRSHRLAAVEEFDVNALRRDAEGYERVFHVCHESSRTTEVHVGLLREADLVEDRSREATGSVEIFTHLVARTRPAVANIAASVSECEHEAADFGGKWMMFPIASSVDPRDLPRRAALGKGVQHRQNR